MSLWQRQVRKMGGYLHNVIGIGEHAADDSKEYDNDTEEAEEAGPGEAGYVFMQTQWRYDKRCDEEDHPETHDAHGRAPRRNHPHHNLAQSVAHDHVV